MTTDHGTCSCAACAAAAGTPGVIRNRPGLPAISYRSGTHGDFFEAMLAGLSRKDRPALARLRTRDPDDPTIALLDAFAITCDVLTFYTERLANESFLGTATERTSLQELGALVAYRLGRGAVAETMLAFSLERPPATPPLDRQDPGIVPPAVPLGVVLPARLRVQSVPGPGETPQTFETIEEIEARPEWNALPVARTRPRPPAPGRRSLWFAGTALGLFRGDALLFAGDDPESTGWDVRLITAVEADLAAGRTRAQWELELDVGGPPDPSVQVFRKRVPVFGHNAPVWMAMGARFQNGYMQQPGLEGQTLSTEWPLFDAVRLEDGHTMVDLDGAHADIVVDSWVVLSEGSSDAQRALYRVIERAELSHSAFAISGRITRLTLEGEEHDFGSPRTLTVMAVPEPLEVVEAPDGAPVTDATITVDGDATGMAPGRTVMIAGTTVDGSSAAESLVVDEVVAAPGGRSTLVLQTAPATPYERATAVVFGNVARATHGETVTQILGSGDARVPFAAYRLQQLPLTFVPADTPRGAASTLEVRVDDVRWKEVPTTAIAGSGDRVFATRDEPGGGLSVVFGDGERGARPPTGSNNLRATYRKGTGAGGNVRRDTLSQPLDRPLGLKGVTNPTPAAGGVDAEAESHARRSIPIPVRTLGRAVSLRDHADFALAFTGIGKAEAVVLPLRGGPTIVVTVADEAGLAPPDTIVNRLASELRHQGDPLVRLVVLPCRTATFRIALTVKVDPDRERDTVLAAVEAALRDAYSAPARAIGEPVHRSEIVATAASVIGVVAVDLDHFYRGGTPSLQSRLIAEPAQPTSSTPLAAELFSLSPAPFDRLQEMP